MAHEGYPGRDGHRSACPPPPLVEHRSPDEEDVETLRTLAPHRELPSDELACDVIKAALGQRRVMRGQAGYDSESRQRCAWMCAI